MQIYWASHQILDTPLIYIFQKLMIKCNFGYIDSHCENMELILLNCVSKKMWLAKCFKYFATFPFPVKNVRKIESHIFWCTLHKADQFLMCKRFSVFCLAILSLKMSETSVQICRKNLQQEQKSQIFHRANVQSLTSVWT